MTRHLLRALLVTVTLVSACAASTPPARYHGPPPEPVTYETPTPVTSAAPTTTIPAAPPVASASTPPVATSPCPIMLHTRARVQADSVVVEVFADNTSGAPADFDLPDRCPRGPVAFEGLGEGFDYEDACRKGACAGTRRAEHVHLAPAATRRIGSAEVGLRRDACHAAVPPGHHRVRAVPPEGIRAECSTAATFVVPAAPPSRPASGGDRACTTSADCTIFCPNVPGCCGNPCGCRNAIRRDRAAAYAASYAKTCTRPPHCPAMGCAYQPAMSATCRDGRCVASSGLGP